MKIETGFTLDSFLWSFPHQGPCGCWFADFGPLYLTLVCNECEREEIEAHAAGESTK